MALTTAQQFTAQKLAKGGGGGKFYQGKKVQYSTYGIKRPTSPAPARPAAPVSQPRVNPAPPQPAAAPPQPAPGPPPMPAPAPPAPAPAPSPMPSPGATTNVSNTYQAAAAPQAQEAGAGWADQGMGGVASGGLGTRTLPQSIQAMRLLSGRAY